MSGSIKILIVEDNKDISTLMSDRLKKEHYNVLIAYDGQDAWDKIVSDDPDIILLDIMMPKLDGFSLLKKLREEPPTTKYQPVIIISAKDELADIKRGMSLEADHYITKPWQIEDILKGVKTVLKLLPQRKSHLEQKASERPPDGR